MTEPILSVRDLRTTFSTDEGVVRAVDGLSFNLGKGETLGIVGESGSGKSVTQLSILGLIPSPPGKVEHGKAFFTGKEGQPRDLLSMSTGKLRKIRGNQISMIFQDPMSSLNPFLRISKQLTEVLRLHRNMSKEEAAERAIEMLEKVGIPSARERFRQYPHQFSGGMRQRVMIAMALLCDPELLIADEPTTALDVTIQAQILELINELQREFGTSVILITHDLGVVAGMADRIIVMYAGKAVEEAETDVLFKRPAHPYTMGLLRSIPRLDQGHDADLIPIDGLPPNLSNLPDGCPFHPRCPLAVDKCKTEFPEREELEEGHTVLCWRADEAQELHTEELLELRRLSKHVDEDEGDTSAPFAGADQDEDKAEDKDE